MRLNYPRTFLLSLAFCGLQVLFAVYNAYMPILLQAGRPDFDQATPIAGGFGLSALLTGFVMSLENLAAIMILPFIGALSDGTASRLGRRKPFLIFGVPITALSFAALPLLLGQPLWLFMLAALVFIIFIDVIRTPIIALMPDITPSEQRSQANGVVNLMGGVGAVLAFVIGGALFRTSTTGPFFFGALALIVGCFIVVAFLRVPSSRDLAQPPGGLIGRVRAALTSSEQSALGELRLISRESDRSTLLLLGAIFCVFLTYGALTVFFTSFATDSLGVPRGTESQLLTYFALSIVVLALPAGILGARIGRRRTMLIGMLVMGLALAGIGLSANLLLIRVLLVIAGAGWSMIGVNALPMVLDSAPTDGVDKLGLYTGIYFIATQFADVFGPTLVGLFIDLGGREYRLMFVYVIIALAIAAVLMWRVRSGEARVGGLETRIGDTAPSDAAL
ncbi:MAG: SLC45 family MFS transporter [Oscillochloris sp.]|nr:SLC45 family MFS transporter [Oscillochloris sp.]